MNVHISIKQPPAIVVNDCQTLPEMANEYYRLRAQEEFFDSACEYVAGRFPAAYEYAGDLCQLVGGTKHRLQRDMADIYGSSWADVEAKARVLNNWTIVGDIDEDKACLASSIMVDVYQLARSPAGERIMETLHEIIRLGRFSPDDDRKERGPKLSRQLMANIREARS